ncbi:hypothetical protein UlMin_020748 [Ulmus minor]
MEGAKGTVTALSSIYSPEEAQKAAKRVEDAIGEKQEEMDRLRGFISDNTNLINLVQKLPDQLHHDIMVPFGKAAFFPGRLIHTNEFLVLLGEGYYAETTCKQTVEILKRRGKGLESQVDSLKAMVKDLEAEASFFDNTASEAAEGIVEIREDYVEEESSAGTESESGFLKQSSCGAPEDKQKVAVEDEEFARMMSRLDELEKEELAAETNNGGDGDENIKDVMDDFSDKVSLSEIKGSEMVASRKSPDHGKNKMTGTEEVRNRKLYHQGEFEALSNCTGLTVPSIFKDGPSHGNTLASTVIEPSKKTVKFDVEEKVQVSTLPRSQVPVETSNPEFDSSKAFSGSIVERTYNLDKSSRGQTLSQSSGSQPSKPVSRFKLQRK